MSWKRSKDGGLDYDTTKDTAYERAKKKMFNPASSAHTMTYDFNLEHVQL